jgi:Fe2+ or Zn2+ uptake regulation protein
MKGKRLTTKEFIEKAKKIHGKKYNYFKVNYINAKTKIKIVCPIHREFDITPNNHLTGNGCKLCGIKRRTSKISGNILDFIKKAKKVHKNKYDYSKSIYKNSNTKIKIICANHGEFNQFPNHHLNGSGCPKCANNINLTLNEFIEKSKLIHNNKYDYSKVKYKNHGSLIVIICPNHGEFIQSANAHLSGKGCSKCIFKISKPEISFLNYMKISEENRQVYIKPYKIDGIDLKTNTLYEFLGDYFHGNPKKFNKDIINKTTKKSFGELYQNTFKKFDKLKSLGYNIKYIWESDWKKWSKNKIGNIPLLEYN